MYGKYTEGVWPIHINDLNCTGSEESVWECPHNGMERYSCNHYQDASVKCQGKKHQNRAFSDKFSQHVAKILASTLLKEWANVYYDYK